MSLIDLLLIVLLIAALGGFGWNAGWRAPAGPVYFNPLGLVLLVLVVLLLVALLAPWPMRHSWY
jgi:hypothetical protein